MRNLILLLVFLSTTISLFSAKTTVKTLSELLKPTSIHVDAHQFFITEGATIYIYSLKDFQLQKKFGQSGEGPQEFKVGGMGVNIDVQSGRIVVNSISKVSYFSRNGSFIKEMRVVNGMNFKAVGNNFVGIYRTNDDKANYEILNVYNSDFKKIKEIYRQKDVLQPGQDILLGKAPLSFNANKNYIFVYPVKEFLIKIFDKDGNFVSSIEREYSWEKISDEEKKAWHKDLELTYPEAYQQLRHRFKFTPHWPAIRRVKVDDNLLYITTFKKKRGKIECFLYDLEKKSIKKILLPIMFETAFVPYPFTIKKGKIYQLVENTEKEKWELHITTID